MKGEYNLRSITDRERFLADAAEYFAARVPTKDKARLCLRLQTFAERWPCALLCGQSTDKHAPYAIFLDELGDWGTSATTAPTRSSPSWSRLATFSTVGTEAATACTSPTASRNG